MSRNKKIWIPAIVVATVAVLLVAYSYYLTLSHGGQELRPRPPEGGGTGRPPQGGNDGAGGYFTTLGTISLFLGAAGFSWFWFKKKLKSPSPAVRYVGKLLHSIHKFLGWTTLVLIVVHGIYFLIVKLHDEKIYTGLAGLAILLALAGYGYSINKVRNKWMRAVHRSLGIIWVPVLLLHAGGSAIMAVISALAVGGLVWVFERSAVQAKQPAGKER
ncbi:hypothetical protein D7Z26_17630 [Cohnella endophytica]|uniref:Ferric oxidoreductase domain-containing protein n=1 Tax=Cohnella endophytica TaxID=2419778 RepID=A0A494XU32_9BACL|nr:hypothetical protein [Cohnella endophytica]RKP51599.1 hypothetical protein D7Z26_17630 [Cohnella endophytica]